MIFESQTSRKTVSCPGWYTDWQNYQQCYPAEEFSWCWNVRPKCSKVRVKFTRFAVEEQSRVMANYHGLRGDDACIDFVQVSWKGKKRKFCDESHQNKREFTFSDNVDYDPNVRYFYLIFS